METAGALTTGDIDYVDRNRLAVALRGRLLYWKADDYDFSTEPIAKEKITFQLDTKWLTEDKSTDDPTGISEITASKPAAISNEWYTLEGLRLDKAPTAKGIYIQNGRKVVIK